MSEARIRQARWIFAVAGFYGLIVLLPLLFAEPEITARTVPMTHPVYFYGFVGVALVTQLFYPTTARDPVRFRPLMPRAVLAKLSFFFPVATLHAMGRADGPTLMFASIDLLQGLAFLFAWATLGKTESP